MVILRSWLLLRFLGSNSLVDAASDFGAGVGGDRAVGLVDAFGCGLEDCALVLV
jgi:hypothetical protein